MKIGWETNNMFKGQVNCPTCGRIVYFERKGNEILPDGSSMLTCPKCNHKWIEALSFQNPGIGKRF